MTEKRQSTEKAIAHPIEDVLDIESGTTMMPIVEHESTELAVTQDYDEVDREINEQFQEVYDTAMDAYETQAADIETIEPKFRARNQEVAVQYLNTALNAAKEKASIKMAKDKNTVKVATGGKTVNQLGVVVADRNDVLKEMFGREN